MKFKNMKKEKLIKFFNGKGFYLVAALSLVAIGAAAYTMLSSLSDISELNDNIASSLTQSQNDEQSGLKPIPEETDSKKNTSSKTVPSTESKKPQSTDENEELKASTVADFFIMPISSGEIIKSYSDSQLQFSHTYNDLRLHTGIDIKADSDSPVYSCGKGVVAAVETDALLGTVVTIDHGNGVTAKYCGLNKNVSVKEGQTVDSSVIIGAVEKIPSESVEQSHLHLEFYKNGKPTDPESFIN